MKNKLVVDLDAGTDDAVALLLLLTLESEKDYEIVGITCTHGNAAVDDVCRNVLTTLELVNRLDVPVFRGAEGPLIALEPTTEVLGYFHGKNGFGDKVFPPPKKEIQSENAVAALNRLALDNEGIVLICLGPLTNVALALRTYPKFSKYLKQVYLMGGNVEGVGNFTRAAEFNFCKDPEAAHIVLSSLTCPTTIMPWETTLKCSIKKEVRFEEIGSVPTPHVKMLNAVERDLYENQKFWIPCDALLVGTFLEEDMIIKSRNLHMTVELQGIYTRGQGVVDHLQRRKANIRVVDETSDEIFKKLVFKMAFFIPKNI